MDLVDIIKEYWIIIFNLFGLVAFIVWMKFDLLDLKKTLENHINEDCKIHDQYEARFSTIDSKYNLLDREIIEIKTLLRGMGKQVDSIYKSVFKISD